MKQLSPEEFFAENKSAIYETASFLANKEKVSVDAKFSSMREEYFNQRGTKHKEIVTVDGKAIVISDILNSIRHSDVEFFDVFCFYNGKVCNVHHQQGTQYSCDTIYLDQILKKVLIFGADYLLDNVFVYIVHNHPYKYNATCSVADAKTLKAFIEKINIFNVEAKRERITLADFGIVTVFDYWSMRQYLFGSDCQT